MSSNHGLPTNMDRAIVAWGADMPAWVRLLASACDNDNQRTVADRLCKSSGYISRLINHSYAGSYEEAETIIRAAYGQEDVNCPIFGAIPLASCLSNRRRKAPPRHPIHHQYAATCPACPNNTDGGRT
ncbi:hypothetical protein [Sphingobium aromaticiconvertens]|uniref:hypothetical protein n=1 Tax=Sphingobium aromaticiconvertens TaxID=365341 RepID=UPI003016E9B4